LGRNFSLEVPDRVVFKSHLNKGGAEVFEQFLVRLSAPNLRYPDSIVQKVVEAKSCHKID
jgi:hypothetical protein